MAKVSQEELEKQKLKMATLEEVAPGYWKGPWLEDIYDNRTECWRDNQTELRNRKLKEQGLNEHGQTKEQQVKYQQRLKLAEQNREKAKILEEMMLQNKGGVGGKG